MTAGRLGNGVGRAELVSGGSQVYVGASRFYRNTHLGRKEAINAGCTVSDAISADRRRERSQDGARHVGDG